MDYILWELKSIIRGLLLNRLKIFSFEVCGVHTGWVNRDWKLKYSVLSFLLRGN